MTEIYCVIIEDRHTDTDVYPFTTEADAERYARQSAGGLAWHVADIVDEPLTRDMERDGWVLYITYSSEGDHVRVVRRTLDHPGRKRGE